ncbi:hypothetical protein Pelo_5815 [Pelomyxa schiedti]|nr:hypothetical protein Pelo_5815 [Pelomyxa schiedti]
MATAMFSTLATMAQRPKHMIMPKRACIVWASVLGVYIAFIAKLVASAASQGSTSNLLSPSVYASTLAALTKSSVHQHSAVVAAAATEAAQIQGGDITREQFIQLLRGWDRTGPISTITALEWTLLFAEGHEGHKLDGLDLTIHIDQNKEGPVSGHHRVVFCVQGAAVAAIVPQKNGSVNFEILQGARTVEIVRHV